MITMMLKYTYCDIFISTDELTWKIKKKGTKKEITEAFKLNIIKWPYRKCQSEVVMGGLQIIPWSKWVTRDKK